MSNTLPFTPSGPAARTQAVRDKHVRRMDAIATEHNPRIEAAERNQSAAYDRCDTIAGAENNREPRYCKNAYLYWALMIILAIAEAPLNRLSFELFFP